MLKFRRAFLEFLYCSNCSNCDGMDPRVVREAARSWVFRNFRFQTHVLLDTILQSVPCTMFGHTMSQSQHRQMVRGCGRGSSTCSCSNNCETCIQMPVISYFRNKRADSTGHDASRSRCDSSSSKIWLAELAELLLIVWEPSVFRYIGSRSALLC